MDAGDFRGSGRVAQSKMLKMWIFAKGGDVNNSNFVLKEPLSKAVTSFRLCSINRILLSSNNGDQRCRVSSSL